MRVDREKFICERYNRTVQEEFINNNLEVVDDKILFNKRLAGCLVSDNTKRIHKSLGLKSPVDYLISEDLMSKKSVTYTSLTGRLFEFILFL